MSDSVGKRFEPDIYIHTLCFIDKIITVLFIIFLNLRVFLVYEELCLSCHVYFIYFFCVFRIFVYFILPYIFYEKFYMQDVC